jgi:hypothetical protein
MPYFAGSKCQLRQPWGGHGLPASVRRHKSATSCVLARDRQIPALWDKTGTSDGDLAIPSEQITGCQSPSPGGEPGLQTSGDYLAGNPSLEAGWLCLKTGAAWPVAAVDVTGPQRLLLSSLSCTAP